LLQPNAQNTFGCNCELSIEIAKVIVKIKPAELRPPTYIGKSSQVNAIDGRRLF